MIHYSAGDYCERKEIDLDWRGIGIQFHRQWVAMAVCSFKTGFMRFHELPASRQSREFELPVDISKGCQVRSSTHDLNKRIWNRLASQ